MAETVFKIVEQKIELNDIINIVVTPTEEHPEGGYVREIRFTGTYGNVLSGQPRSLTLRIRGTTKDAIQVVTPELSF